MSLRRDGRAVECTGLENRQGLTPFQGSNPCPSTIYLNIFLYSEILKPSKKSMLDYYVRTLKLTNNLISLIY